MTILGFLLSVAAVLVTLTAPLLAWVLFGVAAFVELVGVPVGRAAIEQAQRDATI
jgi:hypothetical protein